MRICVVGTGTMGSGIVQALIQSGLEVLQKGRSVASLERATAGITRNLARLVEKGKLKADDSTACLARQKTTLSYADLEDCDLVIEAIAEDMEVKKGVLRELDAICKPTAVIGTNTSSLSITELASATRRPDRVVGIHFFNPAPVMQLVEVIRGQLTSDDTYALAVDFATKMGKTPVGVNEAPGFVVNRMLIPMVNEAIGILADGVATREEIDTAMQLGANHPMGPLALADLIGLDVCLAIMEVLYAEFADPKYRPHPLLRKMVRASLLGRKSGRGFYDYGS
ncbi:MAG: 3-hydroxybutyryl-CoA dehydrogenase [Candidatus [Bacteroides] periocalifornicus]|uniref:3-hydroxybutyryl-CoA dehydrogenase n=1 Tax=Candidatus [Bacteroides] periocalifornicus TaxID=1702214 RepID=A0A0Q4B559_9BACT|nr:MAG: 3-hydroxybutyryl-CoA dehydrogenase [Candidatus [Bacteroides] periocalifornicus]